MFYGKKEQVENALRLMQRKVCCYDGLFRNNPAPATCDCKYGYNPLPNDHSYDTERTGCPELRTVVCLLEKMTEREYHTILARVFGNHTCDECNIDDPSCDHCIGA